jgi:predicted acylesterase/phospholipase RssA
MALLTGEPRSASVVTAMDSEVFVLTKQDFDFLLEKHPSIALTLSHVLSQRLRKISIQKAGRQNKILCALNTLQKSRQKALLLEIARKLLKETNGEVVVIDVDVSQAHIAFLLDLEREPQSSRWIIDHLDQVKHEELEHLLPRDKTGVKFFILPPQETFPLDAYFVQLLGVLKEYYTFVLVNIVTDNELTPDTIRTMEQANTILYLLEQQDAVEGQTFPILEAFKQKLSHLQPKLELITVRDLKDEPVPQEFHELVHHQHVHYLRIDKDPVQFLFQEKGSSVIPSGSDRNALPQIKRDVSRIARRLGNVSIGLVLGGGGARAYAHLGILKVLEEASIPIDMIAGTSMGAFLGALHVLGKTNEEILELSAEAWKKLRSPLSWTLPRVSFIKGRRIRQIVHNIFGDIFIEDLPIPFFCVSGDLVSGQQVVMGQGRLYEAILASGALPAFFPPVNISDMQLVDGGVVNNVPGDVLKKQGIDIVIAVDVTPEREVHLQADTAQISYQGNPLQRLLQYIRRLRAQYGTVLLPRLIMRVIAIEGLEITRNKSRSFDIHIKPEIEGFDLFDFKKLDQIVMLGEQTGRQQLPKIQETLDALKR